ncbi:hypothetical protein [Streptomyces sp. NPDC056227]|uniref:hypothetical protein n=1 Tax=Streptomyces sp. NPDC056227 TaxID=3345753 RepID=UPI0035D6F688
MALFAIYLGAFARSGFYGGGANGIRSWALLRLADSTCADITVVVPGTVAQQPEEARQAISHARNRIKEIVQLGAPAFEHLVALALSPQYSVEMVQEVAKEYA